MNKNRLRIALARVRPGIAAAGLAGVAATLALATPINASAPASKAKPGAWGTVVTPAPQGSYVIGNPQAKVKLIEYVSYSCPHCAHFNQDSSATLKRMIASGSTSVEVRSAVHNRFDLVAATLARCSGPAVFPKMHDLLFARQQEWLDKAVAFDRGGNAEPAGKSQGEKMRSLADTAGITAIAKAAGMTDASINSCLANDANVTRTIQVAQQVSEKIRGTPSFELDGKMIQGANWATIEPMLRAAGAK